MDFDLRKVNSTLMNPKRFMIATLLYIFGPRSVGEIAKSLDLTLGDVDSHLRRMEREGFVELRKVPTLKGPRVIVKLTKRGIEEYSELLDSLISLSNALRSKPIS